MSTKCRPAATIIIKGMRDEIRCRLAQANRSSRSKATQGDCETPCKARRRFFYAAFGGEAQSADYNTMPRSVPIKAVARYPSPAEYYK
jgi:hypothetical protein